MIARMERRYKAALPKMPATVLKCVNCPKTIEPGAPGRNFKAEGWRSLETYDSNPRKYQGEKRVPICSDECEKVARRLGMLKKETEFVTRTKKLL